MITLRSNAKLNLTLDLVAKRDDGYHDLRSVLQEITLCDYVSLEKRGSGISVSCNLRYIPTDRRNIAVRVAEEFFNCTGISGGVYIRLKKLVPSCAGLGGGSSNGAATLNGLCRLYGVDMSVEEKVRLTGKIGADIPFFFTGGTALCEGVGERVTPLPSLPRVWFVIAKPPFALSTPVVFSSPLTGENVGGDSTSAFLSALEKDGVRAAFPLARNALEPASIELCGAIEQIKREFAETGAFYSAMSGSGSAVFGVFDSHQSASAAYERMKEKYRNTYIAKPVE